MGDKALQTVHVTPKPVALSKKSSGAEWFSDGVPARMLQSYGTVVVCAVLT